MNANTEHVRSALTSIQHCLHQANSFNLNSMYAYPSENEVDDNREIAEHFMERAFVELLLLLDTLGLDHTYRRVKELHKEAEANLIKSEIGEEEPYLVWRKKLTMYVDGLRAAHGLQESEKTQVQSLIATLRACEYAICDPQVFPNSPGREADVHDRIEAILRCIHPDLLRKPRLSKPIKSFEPDTGIPSIRTLIEYKFITSIYEAKAVIDQILADSRGYHCKEWKTFMFVIYETSRIHSEKQWEDALRANGLDENFQIVILAGNHVKENK